MICFQISIFAESYTPLFAGLTFELLLWFAFKLVSLQSHIHHVLEDTETDNVVICFQISIFAESYTPNSIVICLISSLWFAFKLVSLQSHIHRIIKARIPYSVVICFQISIFAESYTPAHPVSGRASPLWFAFKLVSLQSHIHLSHADEQHLGGCDLLSN